MEAVRHFFDGLLLNPVPVFFLPVFIYFRTACRLITLFLKLFGHQGAVL